MIDTDFQFEADGPLVDSPRWAAPGDAPASSPTVDGGAVVCGSGTFRALALPACDRRCQRVEVAFERGTAGVVGAFACRRADGQVVYLSVDQATGSVVYQEFGGAAGSATLGTVALAGRNVLRLEVVGRRLRWWVDPYAELRDRPPDGGRDLAAATDDDEGGWGWGLYLVAPAADNGIRVTRFTAARMPRSVMPPPHLKVSAAQGYNFAPVTLTATSADAPREWEVAPLDPSDFPEAYRAVTAAGVASHVVYVRAGFNYHARSRPLGGPWNEYVAVAASGTGAAAGWASRAWQDLDWPAQAYGDGAEDGPLRAEYGFPADLVPDFVLEGTVDADVVVSTSTTGYDRTVSPRERPARTYQMKFEDRLDADYQRAIDFFDFMLAQKEAFNWVHPITGERLVMRFAADDYLVTYKDHSDDGEGGGGGGGSPIVTLALPCVESAPTSARAYPLLYEVDPSALDPAGDPGTPDGVPAPDPDPVQPEPPEEPPTTVPGEDAPTEARPNTTVEFQRGHTYDLDVPLLLTGTNIVVQAVGTGAPPVLRCAATAFKAKTAISNVTLRGLDVRYVGTSRSGRPGLDVRQPCSGLLVEDCDFTGFTNNVSLHHPDLDDCDEADYLQNVTFRRCGFYDARSTDQYGGQGGFFANVNHLTFEDCVFDNNGWRLSGLAGIWAHGAYVSHKNLHVRVLRTVFSRNAAHGCQARATGSEVVDCLFVDNGTACLLNGPAPATFTGNVVLAGHVHTDVDNTGRPRWRYGQAGLNYHCAGGDVSGNWFIGGPVPPTGYYVPPAISVTPRPLDKGWEYDGPSSAACSDNRVCGWRGASHSGGLSAPPAVQSTRPSLPAGWVQGLRDRASPLGAAAEGIALLTAA